MSARAAHSLSAWVAASRPQTLFASAAPVLLGTALAFSQRAGDGFTAVLAFLGAVFIQIGTNLANDYWDAKKGADGASRLGPVRVTASGLISPGAVLAAMWASFGMASIAGIALIARAGWPVAVIGVVSIICGILYTAGPFPLAYLGLGDIFTFVFFGLVATAGTYFVQTGRFSVEAVVLGAMPGFYSVVLIALNNLRDRESDLASNKRTLAVRFGDSFARWEIVACLAAPMLIPLWLAGTGLLKWWMALLCICAAMPGSIFVSSAVFRIRDLREVNRLLPVTGLTSLATAVVISVFLLFSK